MKRFIFAFVLVAVTNTLTISAVINLKNSVPQATIWYGVIKTVPPSFINPDMTPSFQSVTYYLQGDTVFNDTTYQALWGNDGEYMAGLRMSTDGQQVYIRPTETLLKDSWWDYTKAEHLLYDFDVQVGDTVFAFDGSYHGIDNMGDDLSIQYRWIVQDVQIVDGRKHIIVIGGQLHSHQVEWIEGIGTRLGFFENVYEDALGRTCSSYALCAADNDGNTLYSFNTDDIGIRNNCPTWEEITTSLETETTSSSAAKLLRDGQIFIIRGDKTYTITGQRVE